MCFHIWFASIRVERICYVRSKVYIWRGFTGSHWAVNWKAYLAGTCIWLIIHSKSNEVNPFGRIALCLCYSLWIAPFDMSNLTFELLLAANVNGSVNKYYSFDCSEQYAVNLINTLFDNHMYYQEDDLITLNAFPQELAYYSECISSAS